MSDSILRRRACIVLLLIVVGCYLLIAAKNLNWHYSSGAAYSVIVFPFGTSGIPVEVYRLENHHELRYLLLDAYASLYGSILTRETILGGTAYGLFSRSCRYGFRPQIEGADYERANSSGLIERVSFYFAEQDGFETGGSVAEWKRHFLADITERYEFTIDDQMRALLAAPKTPMQEFLWELSYAPREKWMSLWGRLLLLIVVVALFARKARDIRSAEVLVAIPMGLFFIAQHKTFWIVQAMIDSWEHGGVERNMPFSLLSVMLLIFWLLLLCVLAQIPGPFRNSWARRFIHAGSAAFLIWTQLLMFSLDSPLAWPALWASGAGVGISLLLMVFPNGFRSGHEDRELSSPATR